VESHKIANSAKNIIASDIVGQRFLSIICKQNSHCFQLSVGVMITAPLGAIEVPKIIIINQVQYINLLCYIIDGSWKCMNLLRYQSSKYLLMTVEC